MGDYWDDTADGHDAPDPEFRPGTFVFYIAVILVLLFAAYHFIR
jgi:hypothetical protein